jgi:glycosyltransferase involved in cell wall biosynthesis
VGVLVALAAAARRRPAVVAVPAAVAVVAVGSWAIEQARGVPSTGGGTFLLVGAIAFTAARLEPSRRSSYRFAAVASTGMAAVWFATAVRQITMSVELGGGSARWSTWRSWKLASSDVPAWIVLCGAALACVSVIGASLVLSPRRRGVNIIGYHTITAGLGERTRQMVACCEAAGLRVAAFDLDVASVRERATLPVPSVRYDTSVLVVPAFETSLALDQYGDVVSGSHLVAGYWFWELEEIPPSHRGGLDVVDEVWAPTRFVRDAYSSATEKPVRLVPLPTPEPEPGPFDRTALGLRPDDFVFLTSFSYLSVLERKNPIGTIKAFRKAFPDDPSVRLVVKSINGDRKPVDVGRVRDAAGDDSRILMWDEHVDAATQAGLIASADVFVSLHRSEGLGLHIVDAMWLGTPVIATDYSGSRDVIDETCGVVVPAVMVRVTRGDGAYPETSVWAEPDLDAAVTAMRRLRSDPVARRDLAAAARARRLSDDEPRSAGRRIRRLVRGFGR